jgi:sugar-specific transcriptional regulator TrmB
MRTIKKILTELGVSEKEASVYIHMIQGIRDAKDLLKITDFKRPTLYYVLTSLEKRGLVKRQLIGGTKKYIPENPEVLIHLAKKKALEMEELEKSLLELLPTLVKQKIEKPNVSLFEGHEAVKSVIMSTLYTKNHHIDCIAPSNNFFFGVGEHFVKKYVEERRKRKISTRNLWEEKIASLEINDLYRDISSIRVLPKIMKGKWKTTIFIHDHDTLYVSSYDNAYAILIKSEEHAEMMRCIFDGLWHGSTDD